MVKQDIILEKDINSRAATHLVYSLAKIPFGIYFAKDNRSVNAKSVLGILSLDMKKGDKVEVTCYTEGDFNIKPIIDNL